MHAAGDKRAEVVVLLVQALVDVAAVVVGVHLLRAGDDLGVGMDVGHGLVVAEILALGGFAMLQLFGAGSARLVYPDARADDGLSHLQVGRQELDLVAAVHEAVPIVRRAPRSGVVEVLEFVGPADDAQHLVGVASCEWQHDGFFGRVIGLGLEHDVARGGFGHGCDGDIDLKVVDGGCVCWRDRGKPR